MKFQYLLILGLLLVADIFAYTEVVGLIRKPSDTSVVLGLVLLAILIVVNFLVIRFTLSRFKA